jgi:biotin transport system substrate-specific component
MYNTLNRFLSKQLILCLSFTLALIIASNVTIPFYPVEFTLQTLILTVAILYDAKLAFKSASLYIALGILGLPVFASLSNALIAFKSPSLGYIVGMWLATFILSYFNLKNTISKILIFNVVVFSCGITVLSIMFNFSTAIYSGLVVFILPETIKTLLAYKIYKYIK